MVWYVSRCIGNVFDKLIWCTIGPTTSYLALHSSFFGPDGTVNCDYIITNSINSLLIGSRCTVYVNKISPYNNGNYLSSTVSIV